MLQARSEAAGDFLKAPAPPPARLTTAITDLFSVSRLPVPAGRGGVSSPTRASRWHLENGAKLSRESCTSADRVLISVGETFSSRGTPPLDARQVLLLAALARHHDRPHTHRARHELHLLKTCLAAFQLRLVRRLSASSGIPLGVVLFTAIPPSLRPPLQGCRVASKASTLLDLIIANHLT